METKIISTDIANGTVHYIDRLDKISDVKWTKHPRFKGVYMKKRREIYTHFLPT